MKTLKLKDITAYLPYGLKLKIDSAMFLDVKIVNVPDGKIETIEPLTIQFSPVSNYRPYLRPISDLTKEITHQGERFVPLLKIAKFLFPYWEWRIRGEAAIALNDRAIVAKLIYEVSEGYFFYSSDRGGAVKHWPAIIDLLSEWMFDYRGLIPDGLAIDVNTLDVNPYAESA